jgi:26S proteasome regulatory subunit N12
MADRQLAQILNQLKTQSSSLSYPDASTLLSKAKLLLLQLDALTPTSRGASNDSSLLATARSIYEQGALCSIRARNPDAFLRYVSQLAPFYELPETGPAVVAERNKVTGLYLLLLLTQGRYAEFHSELEALAARGDVGGGGSADVEGDRYLGYPIRLERWLMEGSYDRVWKAMKKGEVPCEEYGVFSEVSSSFCNGRLAVVSSRNTCLFRLALCCSTLPYFVLIL